MKHKTKTSPAFIVGYARSGTTLLAAMLDRHSQLAVTPETHFFDEVVGRRPVAVSREAMLDRLFASERFRDLELDPGAVRLRFVEEGASWAALYESALAVYAGARGKARAVDKTPAHLSHVPRILDWFPDARVLSVVRDGRDAALSNLRAPFTHNDLRRHSRIWCWCVRLSRRYVQRFPGRVIEVRYEALVEKTAETLKAVDAFLGVPFEPQQIDAAVATGVVPDWERRWKDKAAEGADASRAGAWKREAAPQQQWIMNSMMGRELRRLGYGDTRCTGCPPPIRLGQAARNAVYRTIFHPALKPCFVPGKYLAPGIGRGSGDHG